MIKLFVLSLIQLCIFDRFFAAALAVTTIKLAVHVEYELERSYNCVVGTQAQHSEDKKVSEHQAQTKYL